MFFYTARYERYYLWATTFFFFNIPFSKWKMHSPLNREPGMELIAILFQKFTNDSVEITMEKESRKEL